MHELAVTQNVIELVIEEARKSGAARVRKVELVVGGMHGLVEDSVRFYFDLLARDTMAQGASLVIESLPLTVRCHRCKAESRLEDLPVRICLACGNARLEVVSGKELFVRNIEVE
jgi:hydrogenase nickel incorporation protein HypA/HybF